jgi:hypothetical protein
MQPESLEDGIQTGLFIQNHFQELCGKEILKIKLFSEHCEEKFQTTRQLTNTTKSLFFGCWFF